MSFNHSQIGISAHLDIDAICPDSKPRIPDYSALSQILHYLIKTNGDTNGIFEL